MSMAATTSSTRDPLPAVRVDNWAGARPISGRHGSECRLVLGIIAALAGGASGLLARPADAQQRTAAPPPAVSVVAVARKNITPSATFTGRIEAIDRVDLRARVEGYLETRQFSEGGEVKAGQLLFTIEKDTYVAAVAQAKATVARAESSIQLARIELARQDELVRKQVASQQKLDEARAKYGETEADLQRQKAMLDQAQIDLKYTEIYSPIAGQIGRSKFSVGNYLTPRSGTLATVVSRDPMYVTFPVTQRELLAMRQRAREAGVDARAVKVRLRLADGSLYEQDGSVNFIDIQVSAETDTVTVRADVANPQRLLVDGQLVTAVVETAVPKSALVVPQQALQFDQTGYFVLIVDSESKVKVRPVGIGPAPEGHVEITSGLQEGDRVITEGIQKVRPEQVVQVAEIKGGAQSGTAAQ
jgi:membrane fusion protein (multidrug efflux system)